jgi:hypothetical protein
MSPDSPPADRRGPGRHARARRSSAERALEAVIRLSGVSAIVFVAAIFFFVLREARRCW